MSISSKVVVDKITFHVKAWKAKNGKRRVRLFAPGTLPAIDLDEGDGLFKYLWGRLHSPWKKRTQPKKKAPVHPKKSRPVN